MSKFGFFGQNESSTGLLTYEPVFDIFSEQESTIQAFDQ